eukprot:TRINITY_DN2074_c0_g2_i1.p1 TRINITY_DN2074_c0_g2~~TRINITY_DN2074_c0_g2_i1.p1  ORF type:complete len:532 (-),score=77.83 TRINITY_DN2074_c0_g2_i1:179-1774(-)
MAIETSWKSRHAAARLSLHLLVYASTIGRDGLEAITMPARPSSEIQAAPSIDRERSFLASDANTSSSANLVLVVSQNPFDVIGGRELRAAQHQPQMLSAFVMHATSDHVENCRSAPAASWSLFLGFLMAWTFLALLWQVPLPNKAQTTLATSSSAREGCWDRTRFHLMTAVVWSHWIGKWGLEDTKIGWVILNWLFFFHVTGFVFLSGVFTTRYVDVLGAGKAGNQARKRLAWSCADAFLAYVAFSWLRGVVYMSIDPTQELTVSGVLEGTFLFHQGPWYLAALIFWRLVAPMLWSLLQVSSFAILLLTLLLPVLCPYAWLDEYRDPFALREALHYLPFFALGLACGQQRLETAQAALGRRGVIACAAILGLFFLVLWFPLSFVFEDTNLRWMLLRKGVPPKLAGGPWLMVLLYFGKSVITAAALVVFASEPVLKPMASYIEAVGRKSLVVYMVHMVLIMVPAEELCIHAVLANLGMSPVVLVTVLFFAALIINFLCGCAFTSRIFEPMTQPLTAWFSFAKSSRSYRSPVR